MVPVRESANANPVHGSTSIYTADAYSWRSDSSRNWCSYDRHTRSRHAAFWHANARTVNYGGMSTRWHSGGADECQEKDACGCSQHVGSNRLGCVAAIRVARGTLPATNNDAHFARSGPTTYAVCKFQKGSTEQPCNKLDLIARAFDKQEFPEISCSLRNFGVIAFLQLHLRDSLRAINCHFVTTSTRLGLSRPSKSVA